MERAVPYHPSYQLGCGVDVTRNPSSLPKGIKLVSEDIEPVTAQPNFTSAQFSFVESMKDVCDVLGIPPEYALKVQARTLKDPVALECLKDVYTHQTMTLVLRVNFLQKKIYLPYEMNSALKSKLTSSATETKEEENVKRHQEGQEEDKDHIEEEEEKDEDYVDTSSSIADQSSKISPTHLISALEVGNELVIILKISATDHEDYQKFSTILKETLHHSRGIIDDALISDFEKASLKIDKKLKKKDYQSVKCSIHYGCFSTLDKYPADLSGMIKALQQFYNKCVGWAELFKSGVSTKMEVKDMIFCHGTPAGTKSIMQTMKGYLSNNQDDSETAQKVAVTTCQFHRETSVDGEQDSFVVLASETDHMYYIRATLQSDEPEDSEIESFTSFAMSQYPETTRERFEKFFLLLIQVEEAVNKVQDLFKKKQFMCDDRVLEARQILASVQEVHMQVHESVKSLNMITMPSEEFVDTLCSANPMVTVNNYVENVMSKLPPGCDLDLLLIGKTGHGKSSTGNSILGQQKFVASASSQSVTKSSSVAWANVDGRILKAVDTPGVCDTADDTDSVDLAIHAISEAITHCPGGFHALLLVIRFGQRMTTEEKKAIGMLKCILGEDVIKTHCICIITHGDNFDAEMEGKMTFQEWCQKESGFLKDIFEECQFRCVLFNNKAKDEKVIKGQLIELIAKVDNLKSKGTRYTNALFDFAQKQRQKVMSEENMPQITQEMMRDIELVLDHLKNVSKDTEHKDKYASELENLRGMVDNLSNRVTEVEGDQVKLLVDTVFTLGEIIHAEIGKMEVKKENNSSGDREDKDDNESSSGPTSLELQTQAQNLQKIHDTQLKEQAKEVDDKVASEVANEIKENHNCFPACSKVLLRNGTFTTMERLQVGEEVLVRNTRGELCYDTVYMFGHRDSDTVAQFVIISVHNGQSISVSNDHLVFCVRDGTELCLPASNVKVGDELMVAYCNCVLKLMPVQELRREAKRGLYAPFTQSGTIIVDGALMSCYVDVLPHAKAHLLLAPVRLLFKVSPSLLMWINGSNQANPPAWAKFTLKFL